MLHKVAHVNRQVISTSNYKLLTLTYDDADETLQLTNLLISIVLRPTFRQHWLALNTVLLATYKLYSIESLHSLFHSLGIILSIDKSIGKIRANRAKIL